MQTQPKRLTPCPQHRWRGSLLVASIAAILCLSAATGAAAPFLDKSKYHTWEEVNAYLDAVAQTPELRKIVKLIPIGHTREGRPLRVLRISKKGIKARHPDAKPATFIMGAHHAREHVSKEIVLALIDRMINQYGTSGAEGEAVTYLVDAGTFYLLPWVNPDGGTNEFFHNPEQRKTNYPIDEPEIGAAECDICGDGGIDDDSPDIQTGDVGVLNRSDPPTPIAFEGNGIISRHLQLWFEGDDYSLPVVDDRAMRIQPGESIYTFNYEGVDPDGDAQFGPYSGEDFVGGTDPNRNYGDPFWGDCANDEGCSWRSGAQTYCGPAPFSEPETAAVMTFLSAHHNIVSLESLHSGVNEIYPPWFLYEDDPDGNTMDQAYHDAVAQYISQQTGYEVIYGGQYAVNGDTTGYSYGGSIQDLSLELEFYAGGILSYTTEVYGMGSESGSEEAVKDWFPHHWQQFNTAYPQGIFLTWNDFPFCTTCDPDQMAAAPLDWYYYTQYTEYYLFQNEGSTCGGETDPDIFHCNYWGVGDPDDPSTEYYADLDIFAYFNPPSTNRCYKDWNCNGEALVRTLNKQIKHLLYRLYIAPFIAINSDQTTVDGTTLNVAVENTGYLRSCVATNSRQGEDPISNRYYDHGLVDVTILGAYGFDIDSSPTVNVGWLGGANVNDPVSNVGVASYDISNLGKRGFFAVKAGSTKTGYVTALFKVRSAKKGNGYVVSLVYSSTVDRPKAVDTYFKGPEPMRSVLTQSMTRTVDQIKQDMQYARQKRKQWKRMIGPFDVQPGRSKGIIIRKYH